MPESCEFNLMLTLVQQGDGCQKVASSISCLLLYVIGARKL